MSGNPGHGECSVVGMELEVRHACFPFHTGCCFLSVMLKKIEEFIFRIWTSLSFRMPSVMPGKRLLGLSTLGLH